MRGPINHILIEPSLKQLQQREGDEGVVNLMEENEEETILFLMLENQVKREQAQKPEEYLANLLASHTPNKEYTSEVIDEVLQKIGLSLDKETCVNEFWLKNCEQLFIFLLQLLQRAETTKAKPNLL